MRATDQPVSGSFLRDLDRDHSLGHGAPSLFYYNSRRGGSGGFRLGPSRPQLETGGESTETARNLVRAFPDRWGGGNL